MRPLKATATLLLALALSGLLSGCGGWLAAGPQPKEPPAAAALPPDAGASDAAIRFLEQRVKSDPDDFIAYNQLAERYLLRLRESGDLAYLNLALRAAQSSLKAIPQAQNASGLALLIQAEFAAHDFVSARKHAEELTRIEPRKSYPYQLLTDALLELGDYEGARAALSEMERRARSDYSSLLRRARMLTLEGKSERARTLYLEALELALDSVPPSRESVAWCRWQLGEIEFASGNYQQAERHFRDSLVTFPDYYRALSGLARARAALGDVAGAIELYEKAASKLPDPTTVAALGDLYEMTGRKREAETQFELIEQIARLGREGGALYDRQLSLFYADHDLKTGEAYEMAKREYEMRRDIYGADALAWTALKSGKVEEARAAMKEALRLGTKDARLFYHAGMIARAAGDEREAREMLSRALKLSPQFDPRQSEIARRALRE